MAPMSSDLAGKTIQSVEDLRLGTYGYSTVIRFTDGTAAQLDGEDASLESLDANGVLELDKRIRESHERDLEIKRKRAEWLALTCEQRKQRRKPQTALDKIVSDLFIEPTLTGIYQSAEDRTISTPCLNCGDAECPNHGTKVIPGKPNPWHALYAGQTAINFAKTKARRS